VIEFMENVFKTKAASAYFIMMEMILNDEVSS